MSTECTGCGRAYLTRYGIPYLLVDDKAAYSPKTEAPESTIDRFADAVLSATYPKHRPHRVSVLGVDASTAFTIRHLREVGKIDVIGVGTTADRSIGATIEGVPVVGATSLPRETPVVLGAHRDAEHASNAFVGEFAFVYSIAQGDARDGWKRVRLASGARAQARAALKNRLPNAVRRILRTMRT